MKTTSIKVKLTLTEPQLGTSPKDKAIYGTYIASKAPVPENGTEEVATVAEIEQKGWTGFHEDEEGLFLYDYMIRGYLKSAAEALKEQKGLKNVRSKIDKFVFVFPRRIHFKKNGEAVTKPDGVLERPLRAQTMQGPRVTLARSDYVAAGTVIEFEVRVLDGAKEFTPEVVEELFEYGAYQGLGQFRGGSFGRFTVELSRVSR